MKFGVSINPAKPLVSEIVRLGKLGLDFVEICIEPPLNCPDMIIKKALLLKKTLQENKLFGIGHAYPMCELGNPDITVRATWLLEMKKTITAAARIGLKRVDIHANPSLGFMPKAMQAMVVDSLTASFAYLVEVAKPHGMAIALENTWEFPAEYKQLLSKVDGLHGTLDIGHAFMRDGMDAIEDFLKLKQVDHLHVHDVVNGMDHHQIGSGEVDFKKLAELLKKRKFSGTAMIEVIASDAAVMRSLAKFREFVK